MAASELNLAHSKNLLHMALKHDELYQYVGQWYSYKIDRQQQVKLVYPAELVLQTIYDKYASDPSSRIDAKLYEAMEYSFKASKNGITHLNLIRLIEQQLKAEKEHKAPFTIDCQSLLEILKENIAQNAAQYTKPIADLDLPSGFMAEFATHNDVLKEYGYSILGNTHGGIKLPFAKAKSKQPGQQKKGFLARLFGK